MGLFDAIGSMFGSYSAGKAAKRAQDAKNAQIKEAAMRNLSYSGADGSSASYDPATGRMSTQLGDRLSGQQGMLDQFAQMFGGRNPGAELDPARQTMGMMGDVAFNGQPVQGDFSGLQGMIGQNLDASQMGIGAAFDQAGGLQNFANQSMAFAGNQLGDIGNGQQASQRALDLMRQQAAPEEARMFSNLQDNQFATGRLGSSGGALQTEAFARGLGQADLSRQLAASQEGRNYQQNAFGLASGGAQMGQNSMGLGSDLLSSAFNRFSSIGNLARDVETSRFGQSMAGNQNMFNQLGGIFGMQAGMPGMQRGLENQDMASMMAAFSGGNQLNDIPLAGLQTVAGLEAQRSNAALGVGAYTDNSLAGSSGQMLASAFSGLGQAADSAGGYKNLWGDIKGMFGSGPKVTDTAAVKDWAAEAARVGG